MAEPTANTVKITVDGREVEAREGEVIIAAAERAGVYIPRFCYHPRMKPVGMCRMCLVDVTARGPMLVPSCFIEVTEGQEIFTQTDRVKKAQDGVLEFLLVNHPLDCPVCDKGGECPLQDQTLAFGPGESRFIEEKRHFEKPIPLSDLVLLDRERCIQCARCTRFAEEIAGDPLIDFFNRGERTEVATYPDHPFASYFSGNTVQICPVGALTATPYRFRARPWDLEQVESTCTVCAVGCRMVVQSSANKLTRYIGLDSDPVNQSWLCDKGRFSFDHVNSEAQLTAPKIRKSGELIDASWGEALDAAAKAIGDARDRVRPGSVAVLGGARLANEDAYAWAKLAKGVVGTDNVDAQLGDGLPAELILGLPRATIDDVCAAPAVVLLAPDIKEELPVLYLRLRAAAIGRGVPIIEIAPRATGLARVRARASLPYRPGEVAALAHALVHGSDGDVGPASKSAVEAARAFLSQPGTVIVAGRPSLAEPADGVAQAVGILAAGLRDARVLPALRRGNVLGALDMGLAPGVLPGRVTLDDGRHWFDQEWGVVPEARGLDALGILASAAEGKVQALVLLGADPLADVPDRELARRALSGAGTVIAVDVLPNGSHDHADVVLPAAAFSERPGTTTNIEGRVTHLGQKVVPPGVAWPDWMIAAELAARLGGGYSAETIDDLSDEIERLAPSHRGLTRSLLRSRKCRDGVVVPVQVTGEHEPPPASDVGGHATTHEHGGGAIDPVATPGVLEVEDQGVPVVAITADPPDAAPTENGVDRPSLLTYEPDLTQPVVAPHDAYALRLVSGRVLYDQGTDRAQHSSWFGKLAAEATVHVNHYDLERLGVPSGGSVRLIGRTRLVVRVVADDSVPRGNAFVPFNTAGVGAADLIDASQPSIDVRMETPQ